MSENQSAQPGFIFRVIVDGSYSVEQLREDARNKYGLDIHICLKVGPTCVNEDRKGLTAPVEAIDDPFIDGSFKFPIPAEGLCLYIGYFKERS